jgi:ribosome recycling factor
MQDKLKKDTETSMQKSIDSFIEDLKKIRTGRANVSMLDNIMVNYYGNPSPLNQVASVSTPDAKSFVIAPWESSILKEIESSIIKANLGMTPQNDGKVIRLKVPELTEERRKDLAKNVKKIAEDARVAIRMARKDANDVLKKAHKDKEISEDDQKKYSDDIQKVTDNFIKKVDEISAQKESDILKV